VNRYGHGPLVCKFPINVTVPSGLAFICELLGGALTGTGATGPDRRFANGMFAVYVDPKVVDTGNFFDGEISRYVDLYQGD
jgi:uncharacterized oxidoreductase